MPSHTKVILALLLVAALVSGSEARPKLRVSSDGFPTGQATPEGAASDLARTFMTRDAAWFRRICIRPYGAGKSRADYSEYLAGVSENLKRENGNPSPDDPKKILKVFAARHLSLNHSFARTNGTCHCARDEDSGNRQRSSRDGRALPEVSRADSRRY
jgi:hypothetical protein